MPEKDDFSNELRQFREEMLEILGSTIRKPIAVRLGYRNSSGETFVEVPDTRTDQPSKYYFHESGGTSFQGEAFLQTGALQPWQIRFNTPILVRQNPLNKIWEITGIDTRYAAQFFADVDQDDGVFIPYNKLAPGMLTSTRPPGMSALVLAAAYTIGDEWRYYRTQETIDWTGHAQIPSTSGKARYVLVQIKFSDGTLEYKYGSEIPAYFSHLQTYDYNLSVGGNTVLPLQDDSYFRAGYIRLVNGMTAITRRNHIWTLQEYLNSGSGSTSNFDKIVVDPTNLEVVVDPTNYTVVYTE